ncbi:hypothetical protein MTR67_051842 [Solanum verrucosum]|uniref:Uncharacterized protein n=1 Tax=Solanum verrucosum TaxID=315347 RepID=A0AAF0ZZG5_SOLVR|nr:hypothetical protein MTR67_051842 [Solanum verrucosum]
MSRSFSKFKRSYCI